MFCLVRCLSVVFTLSNIVITMLGKKEFGLWIVACGLYAVCLGLLALPLGVVAELCSVNTATPGRLRYYFP